MTHPRYKLLRLLLPLILFILGCPAPNPVPPPTPVAYVPPTGITILGKAYHLSPGSKASFLVQVQEPYSLQLQKEVPVTIRFESANGQSQEVFKGKTNDKGLLEVQFDTPPIEQLGEQLGSPEQTMVISSQIPTGNWERREPIYIGPVYNVLLSTDKPVYQPGQVIHLRTLALDSNRLKAAQNMSVTLTIADPLGNKLMRKEVATSQYGIAALDFALDSQAARGDYQITAQMGPTESSRSVEVKPYTLPRFKIDFASSQPYYKPGEVVTGTVDAQYFFGKPVSGGQVSLRGLTSDGARAQLFEVSGQTDASGVYTYEFTAPDYFVGRLENDSAELDLEIKVIDAANHAEQVDESLTIAEQPLLIDAVAESGKLRPGLANIIYLQATYPDGRAAQADLLVEIHDRGETIVAQTVEQMNATATQVAAGQQISASIEVSDTSASVGQNNREQNTVITLTTDAAGLAKLVVTPKDGSLLRLDVTANTADGIQATQHIPVSIATGKGSLLLRPDKAEYRIGETMNLDLFVTGNTDNEQSVKTVWLDVIKGRQTFGMVPLALKEGRARAAIDIDGSLLGTLELNAYVLSEQGNVRRDRRFVLVNPAPAQVEVTTDAEQYKPGDTAKLEINVSRDGQPMSGAVGVSIVDESVFEIGNQEPGFARTYFLLERELLEPRYEINGFTSFGKGASSPYDNSPDSLRLGSPNQSQEGHSPQERLAAESSQQLALAGFFAEELRGEEGKRKTENEANHDAATIQNRSTTRLSSPKSEVHERPKSKIQNQTALAYGWGNRIMLSLPLIGLAFYDGSRKRRYLLIGSIILTCLTLFFVACAAPQMAAPAAAPAGDAAAPAADASESIALTLPESSTATGAQPQLLRLRQFFPETLFWLAEQETDAQGHVSLDVPIADSITTWRVSVLASDKDGNLGSAEVDMKVFQDFFVEPDLPRFLTVGDEIDAPVSLFNYLDVTQTIQIDVATAPWFEFREQPVTEFTIGPNEVAVTYLPIRVLQHGTHDFKVTVTGDAMSDAVLRQVEVLPDGKQQALTQSGKLSSTQTFAVNAPADAVPGATRLVLKLYPGVISQVIDGLEGMLREPYGCFEQTSSTTYPNVMVLDYLKTTGKANPRIQKQAEQYINLGYQRLLSFEVRGYPGGFSLFGEPEAQTMLTAYGLSEFSDMSKVSYVDPALLDRTAGFLFSRQQGDGSWQPQGMTIESGLENMGQSGLLPTAYLVWALADAGYRDASQVQRATAYLHQQMSGILTNQQNASNSPLATPQEIDPYVLAMVVNALVAVDPQDPMAAQLIEQLVAKGQQDAQGYFSWSSGTTTYLGGSGNISNIETTAMTAIVLLRSGLHFEQAKAAIDWLVAQRDAGGMYYSTQTTVLVLKALLLAAKGGPAGAESTVTVAFNGGNPQTVKIAAGSDDVTQPLVYDDLRSESNTVRITVDGERAVQYQLVTEYYLPWEKVAQEKEAEAMRINVFYDRNELKVNDTVGVRAEIELLQGNNAGTVLVDLGIPPGFTPVTEDLDQLVENDVIECYEQTGRQIIVYLTDVPAHELVTLNYRMLGRFPIKAKTPSSSAYNYYTPDQRDSQEPTTVVVKLNTGG